MTSLRLLSYNVRSLRDDRAALVRVVRGVDADVVCVQEAPRLFRWRTRCAALAADCGLRVITGGRPAGDMLLLARPGIEVVRGRDVLLTKARHHEQRGLALAVLKLGDAAVGVASLHLDLVADERLRHAEETVRELDALDVPVIAAGDVNETAGEPAWEVLAAARPECGARGPTERHGRRIDAAFADPSLRVLRADVLGGPDVEVASDHRPLLVEVAVG